MNVDVKMAPYQPLPLDYQESFEARDNYPANLVHRTISTYPSVLREYQERLDAASGDLFETDILKVEVVFRDSKTNNGTAQGL